MIKEQHVKYECRKYCYKVPEEKVCYIPYTTCRMEKETCYKTEKCCKTNWVPEEKVCCIPYTTCRMVEEQRTRCVPKTTCKMEPYTHTYQTCRLVPVCEPVCEAPCAPACPSACDWKSCFWQKLPCCGK